MPRHALSRRLVLVATLAALFAATSVGTAGAAPARQATGTDFCTTPELSNAGRIEAGKSVTLVPENSPYHVDCSAQVDVGGALTIMPGVRMEFGTGRRLQVQGSITFNGTAPGDIVLTSDKPAKTPGDWDGVRIAAEASAVLNGFTIEYGGKANPALVLEKGDLTLSKVRLAFSDTTGIRIAAVDATIQDSEIVDHRSAGIQVTEPSNQNARVVNLTLNGVTIQRAGQQAVLTAPNVQMNLTNNTVSENGVNGVSVSGTIQYGAMTWRGGDMPYVLSSTVNVQGQTLTIGPNAIVKSASNAGIYVGKDARLEVGGSADEPVYLTALADDAACLEANAARITCDTNNDGSASTPSPAGGNWQKVTFTGIGKGGSIDHAIVRYGADNAVTVQHADVTLSNLLVANSNGNGIQVDRVPTTITEARLVQNRGAQNLGNGIKIDTTDPLTVTIRNSVFEQNGRAAVSRDAGAALVTSGNSAPGNTNLLNGYVIEGGDVKRSQTWLAGDMPHIIASNTRLDMTDPAQTLTIQPGVTLKFADNQSLTVNRGRLRSGVLGEARVLITSLRDDSCADGSTCDTNGDGSATQPIRGGWGAISIERNSRGAFLPNTTVRYGGSRSFLGAIYLKHANSSIENAEVSESGTAGIRVEGVNQTLLADNYIHDNDGAGILLQSAQTDMKVQLRRNRIENNGGGAVEMDANVEVIPEDNLFPKGNKYNGIVVRGQARVTRTWHASNLAYVIPDSVQVLNRDARLIVEPGAVVKLDPDAFVSVSGGSLLAEGTADRKVYFTSIHDDSVGGDTDGVNLQPTGWGYIEFKDSGQGGRLVYVEVRGAGTTSNPALKVNNAAVVVRNSVIEDGLGTGLLLNYPGKDAAGKQPEVVDNVIRKQLNHGIEIVAGTRALEPTIQNNEFIDVGRAAIAMDANSQPVHEGNKATNCQINGILVTASTMSFTRRWTSGDLPYVIDRILTIGTGELQIDPGVVVKFAADATLTVDRGRLTVPSSGASGGPVTFTAILHDTCGAVDKGCDTGNDGDSVPFPGYWGRIDFSANSAVSVLRNVRVFYGGAGSSTGQLTVRKGLTIEDSEIAYSDQAGAVVSGATNMLIRGNTFHDNVGIGLVFDGESSGIVDGNVFTGNARPIKHRASGLVQTSNNVAIGNENDAMEYCADVNAIQTWVNDLAREVVCSVNVRPGATLAVEPGVVLLVNKGVYFNIAGRNTRLDAEGAMFTLSAGADTDYWAGLRYAKDSAGGLKYNHFIQGGNLSNGMLDIQSNAPFTVFGNTFLRASGMGVFVHVNANQDAVVASNLIRQVDGNDSVAVRVEQADAQIQNNRIADADTSIRLNITGPDTFIAGNSLTEASLFGGQNRDRTKCVESQANWWGDPTGPNDQSRDPRDPCNGKTPNNELVNEQGAGLKVSDWVDYQKWLTVQPPAVPMVDLPVCGAAGKAQQRLQGSTTPGATVNIYDDTAANPDTPIATTTAGADGRFDTVVNLSDGQHKLSFAATRAGTAVSARTGFRALNVDSDSLVDPAGIRFEYGPYGPDRLPRAQPLRDEAGCATACGGYSAGRVTLPGGEAISLKVPAAAGVTSVEFVQGGAAQALTAGAGGLWSATGLRPATGPFVIRAKGASTLDCQGYAYVGGATGFVFVDSGVRGVPNVAEYGFEVEPPIWVSDPPNRWQRTAATAHTGTWAATDSPEGNYGSGWDTSYAPPTVFDLRFTPAPQLSFWHKFRLGKGDRLAVEARTSPNGTWTKLAEWTDVSLPVVNFEQRVISLEQFSKVRTLWIRFRLQANADDKVDDGWYIDDVVIGPGGRMNGRFDQGEPVLPDSEVQLLQRNLDSGGWEQWNGAPTGQPNPQTTDSQGRYGFFYLPVGEYRVRVTPPQSSGLAPAATRAMVAWNGALIANIPLKGSEPLLFPIVVRAGILGR